MRTGEAEALDEAAHGRPRLSEMTSEHYKLRLYVAGQTPKSLAAVANLKRLCEEHLAGRYALEVIDLVDKPQLAAMDQILAIPTLVRHVPKPLRRVVGDLSDRGRVLASLGLRAETAAGM